MDISDYWIQNQSPSSYLQWWIFFGNSGNLSFSLHGARVCVCMCVCQHNTEKKEVMYCEWVIYKETSIISVTIWHRNGHFILLINKWMVLFHYVVVCWFRYIETRKTSKSIHHTILEGRWKIKTMAYDSLNDKEKSRTRWRRRRRRRRRGGGNVVSQRSYCN